MVRNILLLAVVIFASLTGAYATDVYAKLNFDYEYGTNSDNVQVKVFKCSDSSCATGRVSEISTQIYSMSSSSACFSNLNLGQMNSCMSGYAISGDKAPASGMVVKFTGASANTVQYYLVTLSVNGDTYVTKHNRFTFETSFSDYDYITNDFTTTFTKLFQPRADILSFQVNNLENENLPIQVNVEAGMQATVCSNVLDTTDRHEPNFASGYSDYSMKTDITLQVIDRATGAVITQNTKRVDLDANSCTGTHSFSWTPAPQYENKEVEFKVFTTVVDGQAYQPRGDSQSKIVTVYPEDLTDACWIVANNLLIANDNNPSPVPGSLVITQGDDSYLSFDVNSYKSLDKDGNNLIYNDYTVQIKFDGTTYITETISSNSGFYNRDITNIIALIGPGEYDVEVIVTPVDNGCSILTPTTLTDELTVLPGEDPTPENDAPVIQLPADITVSVDTYRSDFIITDENVATVQTICSLNSYSNARIIDNTNRDADFRVIERLTNDAFNVELSCYAVDEEGVLSNIDRQTITFEEIDTNVAPIIDLGPDVLNLANTQYIDNLFNKISDANDPKSSLTTTCSINDTTRTTLTQSGSIITIDKNVPQRVLIELTCIVEDPSGLTDTDTQLIEFNRENLPPVITANPELVNGGLNLDVTTQLTATDDVQVVSVVCYGNEFVSVDVDSSLVATFTRLVDSTINTQITCVAEDNEGLTDSVDVRVIFDEIEDLGNAPVLTVPSVLNGNLNEFVIGGVSASDIEDGDLTNSIICSETSSDISISLSNGQLTVTRSVNSAINAVVNCNVTDSDGNSDSKSTQILFSEIVDLGEAPELNVPAILDGEMNSFVIGLVNASDLEDGDLTSSIMCGETSADISITLSNSGVLNITRLTNDDIAAFVHCNVTDSDGNLDSDSIYVVFDEIIDLGNAPVLIVPALLNGSLNPNIVGGVSASDIEDGDLTNSIVCSETSSSISITLVNGQLVVTRLVNSNINTTVSCSVLDSDGNPDSEVINVVFDEIIISNNPPVLVVPTDLNGRLNTSVVGFVSASDIEDGDLTNSIVCSETSVDATITLVNGQLVVTRLTNDAFDLFVNCNVTDSDGNFDSDRIDVVFDEIIDLGNAPVLTVPALLNGSLDNNIVGAVSAVDVEDGDLTSSIVCSESSADISITLVNGQLVVTRLSDSTISTVINCNVTDSDGNFDSKNTTVVFDEIIDLGNAPVLTVPALLNGSLNNNVFGAVSAVDVEDGDLTNSIVCSESSADISITLVNGQLVVTRLTNNSINAVITCNVFDSMNNPDSENIDVVFDQIIPNTIPVLVVPAVLNGSTNQNVIGVLSAVDVEDGDLTNSIMCSESSADISITLVNGQLVVTRLTVNPINTIVSCNVTDSDGAFDSENINVIFDRTEFLGNAPVLIVPTSLNGDENTTFIQTLISASDLEDGDLTNSIVCSSNSTELSTSLVNGNLVITRLVNSSITGYIVCNVTDSDSNTDSENILVNFDEVFVETFPHTATLAVNESVVFINESFEISFEITDVENYVDCILSIDNSIVGIYGSGSCVGNFSLNTSLSEVGNYTITLNSQDSNGNVITLNETIEVIVNPILNIGPEGTLVVSPKEGFELLDSIISVNVTHPAGVGIVCNVTLNGVVISNDCQGVINVDDLAAGNYEVKVEAVDDNGNTLVLIDSITVFSGEDTIGNQSVNITTNSTGNGQSEVNITITNETLNNRITNLRPYLICEDGIENPLAGGNELTVRMHTRANMPAVSYVFDLDITDFLFNVDYNEVCTLVVEFRDDLGSVAEFNTSIVFERDTQELKGIPSIRGQEIDFRGHLMTLLKDSVFQSGNNYFSVVLINNEADSKKVTYTITGQDILVQERGTYTLEAYESRSVPMSIRLADDVKPGVYMVRVTMEYDGIRESKLTYLKVGEYQMLPTYTVSANSAGYTEVGVPQACSTC